LLDPAAARLDNGALYEVEVVGLTDALPIGALAVVVAVEVVAGTIATVLLASAAAVVES
jgi:hypothetical protein